MTITAFRAESFRAPAAPTTAITATDVNNARAAGKAEGHDIAMSSINVQIRDDLNRLVQTLEDQTEALRQSRIDMVRSFAPLIDIVIDQCLAQGGASMVSEALRQELDAIARKITPGKITIHCDPEIAAELGNVTGTLPAIVEIENGPEWRAEITLPGGQVVFDVETIANTMKQIIGTISEDLE